MLECKPNPSRPSIILESGHKAIICYSKKSTLIPHDDAERCYYLTVQPGYTVGDLHRSIVANGQHKYELHDGPNSNDDRWWVADQIDLFNSSHLFTNESQLAELRRGMCRRWPSGIYVSIERDKGVYYA
jgi:hypothetical protein